MKTCIDIQDIDLMCNTTKTASGYQSRTEAECNRQDNQQNKSEPKCSSRTALRENAKNIWSKVKGVVYEVTDVLKTATMFVRAVAGFVKCYKKMRLAFT